MKQYTFHAESLELREQAYFEPNAISEFQSLQRIPCSPQCRDVWKDGDVIPESWFEIEELERPYPYTPTFIKAAYPIQQEQEQESEDDIWDEFFLMIEDFDIRDLQQQFQITRRKQ